VESEMTDSVSSEFHDFYEDTVRDSLTSILHKAFGILCREPAEGFSRSFKKRDNLENLLWDCYPKVGEIEIDFLAHVAPLSTLPDVVYANLSVLPNVQVFKSTNPSPTLASSGSLHEFQQKKSLSPEKTGASTDDDFDNFQYVIAEITRGGRSSVLKKLVQLEKDCCFLCSRTLPSLTQASKFKVLETIACVAVVCPHPIVIDLHYELFKDSITFPLLQELFSQGRFVWIKHNETASVIIREMGNKLDTVIETVSDQNQTLESKLSELSDQNQILESSVTRLSEQSQTLESKLSEQSQTLESKLSEQSLTIKALETKLTEQHQALEAKLSEQFAVFQQFLAERFPKDRA
jgi:hypothetical protein